MNKDYISNAVLSAILKLKKDSPSGLLNIELYDADQDYDVRVTIMLLKKETQHFRGMEMFHGKK